MKFKNFDKFSEQYSKDARTFINKVMFATNEDLDFPYFEYVKSFQLEEKYTPLPIIMSDDYASESIAIYESNFAYNMGQTPAFEQVLEDFNGADFIPKYTDDIKTIKKLKFPVTASNKKGSDDYATVGKLKASEKIYERFREKVQPRTKFTALSFKGKPISIVETINRYPSDVDLNRFSYMNEVKDLVKQIYEKYNLDVFNLEILESVKGGLFVCGVNRKLKVNPHQAMKLYDSAYSDFYEARLPNWVKSEMIKECVGKYYEKKMYDSMLIKSKHTMDYSKYVKNDNS